ncbi:MAG: hypothetical protein IIW13_02095, partial [Paludibacteraceae bacterium]|nr:hypothetical protein [Paludibacteraceae bacterium]
IGAVKTIISHLYHLRCRLGDPAGRVESEQCVIGPILVPDGGPLFVGQEIPIGHGVCLTDKIADLSNRDVEFKEDAT